VTTPMNSSPPNDRTEQMEIDASAKWPVLLFFGSALLWLLVRIPVLLRPVARHRKIIGGAGIGDSRSAGFL